MNPGELNKKITIQRVTNGKGSNLIKTQTWDDVKTCHASVKNLSGKEYWTAKEYGAEKTVIFIIRYNSLPDLNLNDRIKFNDKLFNITEIDNVLYKNEIYKIKAMEVIT